MKKITTKSDEKMAMKSCQKTDQKNNVKNDDFITPKNGAKMDQVFDAKSGVGFLRIADEPFEEFQKRKASHFKLLEMVGKFGIPVAEEYSYPIKYKGMLYYPFFALALEENNT